jgi:hypothetical protein
MLALHAARVQHLDSEGVTHSLLLVLTEQAIGRASTQASSAVNVTSFYQLMLAAAVCERILDLTQRIASCIVRGGPLISAAKVFLCCAARSHQGMNHSWQVLQQ